MTRSLVVVALIAAGLVAGPAQLSLGSDPGSDATVAITYPTGGTVVPSGDVGVDVDASTPVADPPAKVKLFVDDSPRPTSTSACPDTEGECDVRLAWNARGLIGKHILTAVLIQSIGNRSTTSDPVRVSVKVHTRFVVHRARHVVTKQHLVVKGRVISLSKGHPGAPHVHVVLGVDAADEYPKAHHTRTNAHGYYRFDLRATQNASLSLSTHDTRRYFMSVKYYTQHVRGRPHCHLSRHHTKVHQQVALRCHLRHLYINSRFQVEAKIRDRWYSVAHFKTERPDGSDVAIRPPKPGTLTLREIFAPSYAWARSTSNTVRLHVHK